MPANQRTALLVVCLSSFIMPMILSSVNVAIPTIAQTFAADAIQISWVSTAYLLTAAVFLLPCGRLADMKGRKLVYLYGMTTVIIASLLASTSSSIEMLIAWRVLQGMGAAMLFAVVVPITVLCWGTAGVPTIVTTTSHAPTVIPAASLVGTTVASASVDAVSASAGSIHARTSSP